MVASEERTGREEDASTHTHAHAHAYIHTRERARERERGHETGRTSERARWRERERERTGGDREDERITSNPLPHPMYVLQDKGDAYRR